MFVPLHFFQAREGRVFKIQENLCGVLSQIARRLRCSDKRRHANIRRKPEAQHCSSLCSQSEGDEYCGGQTRLKIQRRYALKRWLYSLRVRGPHFASKVSYNAGAATDDYTSQRNSSLRGRCRQTLIFLFKHPTQLAALAPASAFLFPKCFTIRQAKKKSATRGRDSCYSRPQVALLAAAVRATRGRE